ncbi:MAG: alpha-amylase family glycosyl hydrolase [Chloroflexota bacterium]
MTEPVVLATTAAPDAAPETPGPLPGSDWWRDAVIYQVYPRSFADSDGDGVGDLPGIVSRLDYLADLGVGAIWLSPIFPSPGLDVGYDVSDHGRVDPVFGTDADFDRLVAEAHRRDLRIILDLVLNHTSDHHRWFEASRSSRDNAYADWYLWRDPAGFGADGAPLPPNNWVSFFGGSAWEWEPRREQFYMHTFLPEQPDLNWRHPAVESAQLGIVRSWLDRDVDGFRLDVFNTFLKHEELPSNPVRDGPTAWTRQVHVYDRDQPDFVALLGRFRALVDSYPGRFTVGELFDGGPDRAAAMTAEGHLVFDWEMITAPWSAAAFRSTVDRREALFGPHRQPTLVFSNHDQPRHSSRFAQSAGTTDIDGIARAAAVLLLALRGTPFMYYGEELGMVDVEIPSDEIVDPPARLAGPEFPWWNRDQCRTPMAWSPRAGAGFTTGRPWLRIGADARVRNVEAQSTDASSVLSTYRRLIAARHELAALARGSYETLDVGSPEVFAWRRAIDDESVVVVVNFATEGCRIVAPWADASHAVVGTHLSPPSPDADGRMSLRPLEGVILTAG